MKEDFGSGQRDTCRNTSSSYLGTNLYKSEGVLDLEQPDESTTTSGPASQSPERRSYLEVNDQRKENRPCVPFSIEYPVRRDKTEIVVMVTSRKEGKIGYSSYLCVHFEKTTINFIRSTFIKVLYTFTKTVFIDPNFRPMD